MIERSCPRETVTTAAPPSRASARPGSTSARRQREAVEVDADQLKAGCLADTGVPVDELAVGERDEHLVGDRPVLLSALAKDAVVEDGLG